MAASHAEELEAGFARLRHQFGDRVDDVLALLAMQLEGAPSEALLAYLDKNPLPPALVQSATAELQHWAASTGTIASSDETRRLLAQQGSTIPVQGSVTSATSLFSLRLGATEPRCVR